MKGFTLIETLVAVAIIMVAIVGPISVMHRTYAAAYIARDKLTASYLAQEGIEDVRVIRDNFSINSDWAAFTAYLSAKKCDVAVGTCRVDEDPATNVPPVLASCSGATACLVELSGGYYRQLPTLPANTRTIFTRTIQSESFVNDGSSEERIISEVSWTDHGTPYSVKIYDHLTPWQ
ncbi:MAG TPA: prepilin-type N-terminal cleavage/methylation domain-containing protein [Candidatus Paceibacterota bacterium]|nr:prepilin-type N-terminal cleavage/methylation domain-containing protein [Candidatus Paceibacterota bacterium]